MPTRKPRSAKRSAVPLRARRKRALNHQSTATSKLERRRGSPETLRLRALEPSFTVNDLERRLRFYVDVLGFIVGKRWTDGGVRRGVTLKAGVCELGLLQDDWARVAIARRVKPCASGALLHKTSMPWPSGSGGAKAVSRRGHKDQSCGERSLSVDDPDGFQLTIYRER